MHKKARLAALSLGGLLSVGLVGTLPTPESSVQAQPAINVAASIERWQALRENANAPFESYANFILSHRNWPNEMDLRRRAERNIVLGSTGIGDVTRFFAALPPLTAQGHAAHALALEASGQPGPAAEAARRAWTAGQMPEAVEQRILSVFGRQFGPANHDARIDALLSSGDTGAARRAMQFGSPDRRAIYDARLALQARSPDAPSLVAALGPAASRDPGLVYDRANYMNRNGNPSGARQLLAQRGQFDRPPGNPEPLMKLMVSLARGAAEDGQARQAFGIASKLDDLYPAGTDISTKSFGERDEYTNLSWLAGWTAIRNGRPAEAAGMFDRYGRAAKSGQTRAKGFYWAARAARAAGQADRANAWLNQAAASPDQFYGLLALEQLGRTPPPPPPALSASAAERGNFARQPLVEAVRYLGASGRRSEQTQFVRALALALDNERDRGMAAEFGKAIGRPDLAVWVARESRSSGANFYNRGAFPEVQIPSAYQNHWAAAHGIMRQESSFDRAVVSHAGARGMMQLMPATAQIEARRLGVPYSLSRLTDDADYNVLLGSHHLSGLMDRFGDNLVLVAVAYNAGAGRVPQWIARNGDFRNGGVDVVEWIESIPFSETRNYVQRVVENAMVYDLMNPRGSRSGGRVSYFLGVRPLR